MTLFQPHRGSSDTPAAPPSRRGNASGYEAVWASRDFWTIKRRFGSFVGPVCALFIIWYCLFVIIAVFAPGFMRLSVFGDLNVGLCYRLWARRRLDPLSDRLRHRLEGGRRQ
jgi:hypothetical protein